MGAVRAPTWLMRGTGGFRVSDIVTNAPTTVEWQILRYACRTALAIRPVRQPAAQGYTVAMNQR